MALKISDLPEQKSKPTKTLRQRRHYTVAEWLKLPVTQPYNELIEGVLRKMPASTANHSRIIRHTINALENYVLTQKLGQVDSEVNVIIDGLTGKNGWIPDDAYAANHSSVQTGNNWIGIPDWVLEVWAGEEEKPYRIKEKRDRWQSAGVPELWEVILRKGQKLVNVYRLDEQGLYQIAPVEGELICSEVINGFCIEREAIFANLVEE